MKASQSINKTQKTLKETTKMKKTTLTTLIILTISFIFSTISYAAGPSNHSGFQHAVSYLAEKEIRAKEQKAAENSEVHIAINTSVADDKANGYLSSSEEPESAYKKDSGEK
jgi:helix-turn-helix protein